MQQSTTTWQRKVGGAKAEASEESVATVVLVRGENMEGQAQWAYALIPADNYMAFREAEAAGAYDLAAYGTVVASGNGAEPPEDVRAAMAEEYGCNPAFEQEMEAALAEAAAQLPDISALMDDSGKE